MSRSDQRRASSESDQEVDLALATLPPSLQVLLRHHLRRRQLRALHTERSPSTVRELMTRDGLATEDRSRLNYHARELERAGALIVVDEFPAYRSELAQDGDVIAYLDATRLVDQRTMHD